MPLQPGLKTLPSEMQTASFCQPQGTAPGSLHPDRCPHSRWLWAKVCPAQSLHAGSALSQRPLPSSSVASNPASARPSPPLVPTPRQAQAQDTRTAQWHIHVPGNQTTTWTVCTLIPVSSTSPHSPEARHHVCGAHRFS